MSEEMGSSSCSDLPKELVVEILSYLPVKSLIRFSCVCKSWLYLIKCDPQFAAKNYLTRATSSSNNLMDNLDYMLTLDKNCKLRMYSFTETKTLRSPKKFECVPSLNLLVWNSCHGIICFDIELGSHIMLCNPSIQEVVVIPAPRGRHTIGFGFDPISNDYKVVGVAPPCPPVNPVGAVAVYSMCYGQWRDLPANSLGYSVSLQGPPTLNANGSMCNWSCYQRRELGSPVTEDIISFDMAKEVLKEFKMPECVNTLNHSHELLPSSLWQACVSCFPSRCTIGSFTDIWVLGEHDGEYMWSRQLSIRFPEHEVLRPLNFWINDKELLVEVQKPRAEEVLHYDIGTQQFKRTGRKGGLGHRPRGYMESIVSIRELMSLNQKPQLNLGNDDGNDVDKDHVMQEEDTESLYVFREVSRNSVRWSRSFKLV